MWLQKPVAGQGKVEDWLGKPVCRHLVEESLASSSATEAGNAVETANLALELVVISQLLICESKLLAMILLAKEECPSKEMTYSERYPAKHR